MTAVNCWIFYLPSVQMRIHMLCLYPASCQTQTVPATETALLHHLIFYCGSSEFYRSMTYMYMYMHVLLSVFFGGHNRLTEQNFGFAFIFHE